MYPTAHIEMEEQSGAYMNYIKNNKNGRKEIIYEVGEPPHMGVQLSADQIKKMAPSEIIKADPLHCNAYLKAKSVLDGKMKVGAWRKPILTIFI